MSQPMTPQQPQPEKKPWYKNRIILGIIGVVLILGVIGAIGDAINGGDVADPAPSTSAPATTETPAAPETTADDKEAEQPEPSETPETTKAAKDDPTSDEVLDFLAASAGAKDTDQACINGVQWLCNIEWAKANGNVLEIRIRTLEAGVDGDRAARNAWNFLRLGGDTSPLPDVFMVQITTAAEGAVGSHMG